VENLWRNRKVDAVMVCEAHAFEASAFAKLSAASLLLRIKLRGAHRITAGSERDHCLEAAPCSDALI